MTVRSVPIDYIPLIVGNVFTLTIISWTIGNLRKKKIERKKIHLIGAVVYTRDSMRNLTGKIEHRFRTYGAHDRYVRVSVRPTLFEAILDIVHEGQSVLVAFINLIKPAQDPRQGKGD